MIIEIDGIYFNPQQIITLTQEFTEVWAWTTNSKELLIFKNWKVYDLAARINELVTEFKEVP